MSKLSLSVAGKKSNPVDEAWCLQGFLVCFVVWVVSFPASL